MIVCVLITCYARQSFFSLYCRKSIFFLLPTFSLFSFILFLHYDLIHHILRSHRNTVLCSYLFYFHLSFFSPFPQLLPMPRLHLYPVHFYPLSAVSLFYSSLFLSTSPPPPLLSLLFFSFISLSPHPSVLLLSPSSLFCPPFLFILFYSSPFHSSSPTSSSPSFYPPPSSPLQPPHPHPPILHLSSLPFYHQVGE